MCVFLEGRGVGRWGSNSADLVQTPQNAASDQGLYCLITGMSLKNTVK